MIYRRHHLALKLHTVNLPSLHNSLYRYMTFLRRSTQYIFGIILNVRILSIVAHISPIHETHLQENGLVDILWVSL